MNTIDQCRVNDNDLPEITSRKDNNMDDYTTIKTINKFDVLIHKSIENPEDRFFVRNIHLSLAQSILYDFGEDTSRQLANVLLASIEV